MSTRSLLRSASHRCSQFFIPPNHMGSNSHSRVESTQNRRHSVANRERKNQRRKKGCHLPRAHRHITQQDEKRTDCQTSRQLGRTGERRGKPISQFSNHRRKRSSSSQFDELFRSAHVTAAVPNSHDDYADTCLQ